MTKRISGFFEVTYPDTDTRSLEELSLDVGIALAAGVQDNRGRLVAVQITSAAMDPVEPPALPEEPLDPPDDEGPVVNDLRAPSGYGADPFGDTAR